ncbi:MAG: hypothetical protein Q9174_002977 [Haloplaca sp. 1 TL-2023]
MLMLFRLDAKATDPNTPRVPPARPRGLVFPRYRPRDHSTTPPQKPEDLKSLFSCPERLVSAQHAEALNISISEDVPLDALIPQGYLAPKEWLREPSADITPSQAPGKIHNNAPRPSHKDFYHRVRELLHDNDLAFASLSGRPGPRALPSSSRTGVVRLTHTHKFYQNLLLLAEFWDTSRDNYIPPSDPSAPPVSKQSRETYTGRRYGAGHEMPPEYRDDTVAAFLELCIWPFRCTLQSSRFTVSRKLVLQEDLVIPIGGISTTVCANSAEREKARKGIVEGPIMGVHVRYYPPCVKGKKGGHREELMGRGTRIVLDLLHEVGDALLLAQKRRREGTMEKEFGKGAFWTKNERRHLGQMGGEKQDKKTDERARKEIEAATPKRKYEPLPKDVTEQSGGEPMEGVVMRDKKTNSTTEVDKKEEGRTNKGAFSAGDGASDKTTAGNNGAKKRRPNRPIIDIGTYLDAKPPGSMWEPKVEYRMIGKDPSSGYDHVRPGTLSFGYQSSTNPNPLDPQIYLLSSLNHHLSILHVPIHDRYLDLVTNKPCPTSPTQPTQPSPSPSSTLSSPLLPHSEAKARGEAGGSTASHTSPLQPPTFASYAAPRTLSSFIPQEDKEEDGENDWDKLKLRRSRWYDLLDPEDRAECMRGVWGVVGWCVRGSG